MDCAEFTGIRQPEKGRDGYPHYAQSQLLPYPLIVCPRNPRFRGLKLELRPLVGRVSYPLKTLTLSRKNSYAWDNHLHWKCSVETLTVFISGTCFALAGLTGIGRSIPGPSARALTLQAFSPNSPTNPTENVEDNAGIGFFEFA